MATMDSVQTLYRDFMDAIGKVLKSPKTENAINPKYQLNQLNRLNVSQVLDFLDILKPESTQGNGVNVVKAVNAFNQGLLRLPYSNCLFLMQSSEDFKDIRCLVQLAEFDNESNPHPYYEPTPEQLPKQSKYLSITVYIYVEKGHIREDGVAIPAGMSPPPLMEVFLFPNPQDMNDLTKFLVYFDMFYSLSADQQHSAVTSFQHTCFYSLENLLLLHTSDIKLKGYVDKKSNQLRRLRGLAPLKNYYITVLNPDKKKVFERQLPKGSHASPITHERRGHDRTYSDGRRVWVAPVTVNKDKGTPVARHYKVEPSNGDKGNVSGIEEM